MGYYSKPLRRSVCDRWLGGVCSGIGQYLGLDATVVRIVWILLSIGSLGTGALVYVIMWAVIPEREYY